MKKTYILDTNVLLSDPNSLASFEENDVYVPLIVLEELDKQKHRQDEVGSAARKINRVLDEFRSKGSLFQGVNTVGGGTLKIVSVNVDILSELPFELRDQKVDNMIIALALQHQRTQRDGEKFVLVSKDINVRVKCDAIGVACEDYRKMKILSSTDHGYSGVSVQLAEQSFIDELYYNDENDIDTIAPNVWGYLCPHQIVVIKQDFGVSGSTIVRVVKKGNNFVLKLVKNRQSCYGLKPRNKEQNFSLDILYDPNVKLVTLTGIAGSGKSLLALAAGLDQNAHMGSERNYEKLVVARSTVPVGHDVGFLPGTLYEKLAPWQGASIDNLNFLMNRGNKNRKNFSKSNKQESNNGIDDPYLQLLIEKGVIEIASIAHIRGRSIPNSYFIVEKAQNLSHHEVRTILTRIGEGSKVVLCGDTDQIDNLYLDKHSNGLTYVIEKFKDCDLAAHITLLKGERSALATAAAQLL